MKFLSFIFFCLTASATNWYVDNAATGSANGTSWANAWNHLGTVVWGGAGVVAGDTVYISGGSTSTTYTNPMNVTVSGTPSSRITIRAGQDVGHNGLVMIDGSYLGTSCMTDAITCNKSYITINGEVGGQQHFIFLNWFNSTNKNKGRGIIESPGQYPEIFYCIFSNINTGIFLQSCTNMTVGWCKVTAWGDACMALNNSRVSPPNFWDSSLIFSNEMYCVWDPIVGGPDGIQGGDGTSIFHNHFETLEDDSMTNRLSNHVDFYQSDGGQYVKLYDNDCVNDGDSMFSPAPFTPGRGLFNVWIYNNIFRITQQMDPFPQYIRMYNNLGLGGYTNVQILNNLFVDRTNGTQAIYIGPEIGDAPGTGNVIANNTFINVGMNTAWNWELAPTDGIGQSQWTITNNILYNITPANARVRYLGTTYTAAQWKANFDPSTGTNLPAFLSYAFMSPGNNYHLLSSDTAAKDMGLNYSSVFTTDYDGNTRGSSWDIGPYEYIAPSQATMNATRVRAGRIIPAQ